MAIEAVIWSIIGVTALVVGVLGLAALWSMIKAPR
jgi:hypothetical protein